MEKRIKVEIPAVPNFIKAGSEMISIADYTDDELSKIGFEWTEKLIEHAEYRRSLTTNK